MKTLKLLVFVLIFSAKSFASSAGDAAVGVATSIGIGAALSSTAASGLYPGEAEYWLDPQLKTTSKLTEQCGMLLESKVYQNGPWAMILVIGRNNSGQNILLKSNTATVKYDNSTTRYFDLDLHAPTVVNDGVYLYLPYKIHQKSDFNGAQLMEMSIPTISVGKACDVKINYVKNPEYKDAELYYNETFTTGIHIGSHSLSGSLKDLTENGIGYTFKLDLSVFGSSRHGMYLELISSSTEEASSFKSANPTIDGDQWSHTMTGIGYQHRKDINNQSNMYLRVGPHLGTMRYGKYSSGPSVSSSYVGLSGEFRFNAQFANIERGLWGGKYFYHFGADVHYVPRIEFGGIDYSGTSQIILLGVSVGM
jgi:hypothetical protein